MSSKAGMIDWRSIAMAYKEELDALRDGVHAEPVPIEKVKREKTPKGIPPGPPPKKAIHGGPVPPHASGIAAEVPVKKVVSSNPLNLLSALKDSFLNKATKPVPKAKPKLLPASNGNTLQLHWNVPDVSIQERQAAITKLATPADTRGLVQMFINPNKPSDEVPLNGASNPLNENIHADGLNRRLFTTSDYSPVGWFERKCEEEDNHKFLASIEDAFSKKAVQKTKHVERKNEKRVSCLGTQMCQKWTIIYQALRKNHRHFDNIKLAILNCSLRREEISLLMEVVPDEGDIKRIEEWGEAKTMLEGLLTVNPSTQLYPDEQFMKLLISVPNLRFRVESMSAQANFRPLLNTIIEELIILRKAMTIIATNRGIRNLMSAIIEAGNCLNRDTRWGGRSWIKISNLHKIDELRCNHPEYGKRGDAKRSLLSFIASHQGSVISGDELLTIRKALEISIVHPYREAVALLDVFELMESLGNMNNDKAKELRKKRRLSIPVKHDQTDGNRVTDDDIALLEFAGNEMPEDPDDQFVQVCLEFVRSNRVMLDHVLREVSFVVDDYKQLVYYMGCPEDMLPIDKKASDASGESSYIKDIFYHIGRFLVIYEKEVELEQKFKKKTVENDRLKKLRAVRSAMMKPKEVQQTEVLQNTSQVNDENDPQMVAKNSLSKNEIIGQKAIERIARDEHNRLDLASTTSRMLKHMGNGGSRDLTRLRPLSAQSTGSRPDSRPNGQDEGYNMALGVELASEITKRRELSDGVSDSIVSNKKPARSEVGNQGSGSLKPIDEDKDEDRDENSASAPIHATVGKGHWKQNGMDELMNDLMDQDNRAKRQRSPSSALAHSETEFVKLSDKHTGYHRLINKRRRRLSVSCITDDLDMEAELAAIEHLGEIPDHPELYDKTDEGKVIMDWSSAARQFIPSIDETRNPAPTVIGGAQRRRLSVSYVDQDCPSDHEDSIGGIVLSGDNHFMPTMNISTSTLREESAIHEVCPESSDLMDRLEAMDTSITESADDAMLKDVLEQVCGTTTSSALNSMLPSPVPSPTQDTRPPQSTHRFSDQSSFDDMSPNRYLEAMAIQPFDHDPRIKELQLEGKDQRKLRAVMIEQPMRIRGTQPPTLSAGDEYRVRGLPDALRNLSPLSSLSKDSLAAFDDIDIMPEQRHSIEGRELMAKGLRGAGRQATPIKAEVDDSSDSLNEFPTLDDLLSSIACQSPLITSTQSLVPPQFTDSHNGHMSMAQNHSSAELFIRREEREEIRRLSLGSPKRNDHRVGADEDLLTSLSTSRSRTSLKYCASPRRSTEMGNSSMEPVNRNTWVKKTPSEEFGLELSGLCSETKRLLGILN